MKVTSAVLSLAVLSPGPVSAFTGISIFPFKPFCAYACRRALGNNLLACSDPDYVVGHSHTHGGWGPTSPDCMANDTPFLTSLAYCINVKCAEYQVSTSNLEEFWALTTSGDPSVLPKWPYSVSLLNVGQPPTRVLSTTDIIDYTALVADAAYDIQFRTLAYVYNEEATHSVYGIVLVVAAIATPILLTWLGYLPYMSGVLGNIKPYLVYPSLIGTYQVQPLPFLLGNAPTIGQALYIALMVILNVVLTSVNYKSGQPHAWFPEQRLEIMAYIVYRTGFFGLALLPVVILFAGRNNFLLWVTDWPHSTYLLLHRWVARIFALQVLIHSIVALPLYSGIGTLESEQKRLYWIWGAVGTVAVTTILVTSVLYIQRASYEIFLVTHIILAVFVIAGSWYHVDIEFLRQSGFEFWIYAACAVWFFDRLARVGRVLKAGIRSSKVTDIGSGYLRVDVEGIRWGIDPGNHIYAYFPTLNPLRPWQNHPFSIVPTTMLVSSRPIANSRNSEGSGHQDVEKQGESEGTDLTPRALRTENDAIVNTAGVTLFVKKSTGMTSSLAAHDHLITLVDGPYPSHQTTALRQCDRLLLIGGGIGITGLLPWVNNHLNVKLYWTVKDSGEGLVRCMDSALVNVKEKDLRVGQRLDFDALLREETGWARTGVLVCGPAGMCDDVRAAVALAGRSGRSTYELEVEAYSW